MRREAGLGPSRRCYFSMMSGRFTYQHHDRVRLATEGPGPTDPVGEVIEIGDPWVRVKWPEGGENAYLPHALEIVRGQFVCADEARV